MILNIGGGGGVKPRIVVTAPTGSDVTVSKGSTILYAPEVSGTWTFNVPEQGDWSATAILGSKTASKTVSVSKVGVYNVTLRYVSTTLNDNSWEDIKGVADASAGANYWSVGDTKQITLNGKVSDGLTLSNYQTWVYIIGFDHNSSVEGTGIAFGGFKTAQTSGIDVALCDSGYNSSKSSGQWFNMNNSYTNRGGWASCRMRSTTLPLVKSALPSDLQAVLKTTSIYSDNTGGGSDTASYVTATQDELYLLAEFEIFGARTYANSAERNHQQQYAYYVAGNSKIKYRHDSTATAVYWWERSVHAMNAGAFCFVDTSGAATGTDASLSNGLAVAFKVGSNPPPQPISALAVGSSVYCNYNGAKTECIVVHQGNPDPSKYDSSCNGTWCLVKYDANAGGTTVPFNIGNYNIYEGGYYDDYLNTTYLNGLDIKDKISTVTLPIRFTTMSGKKCFALSSYEIGITSAETNMSYREGAKLDYFASGDTDAARQKRIYKRGEQYAATYNWWTRSANTSDSETACNIKATSNPGQFQFSNCSGAFSPRPAFILPLDTNVDKDNNIII